MPLILRSVKGSKLSIPEMDGNLTYLASTLSGSVIQVTGSSMSAPNTSITASFFVGNGSQLTSVTASFVTASNVYGPNGANSILSSSYALSASYAMSSSFAVSSSYAVSSSFAVSSSYALSASYVNPLNQNVQITGSLLISTGSFTISTGSLKQSTTAYNVTDVTTGVASDIYFNLKDHDIQFIGANKTFNGRGPTGSLPLLSQNVGRTFQITNTYGSQLHISKSVSDGLSNLKDTSIDVGGVDIPAGETFRFTASPTSTGYWYYENLDIVSSSSYALTSSYVNPLRQDVQITGSLFVSNSIDSSNRVLYNSAGEDIIDWENNTLKSSTANSVAEWGSNIFRPSSDDSINLGDSSNRWRYGYISRGLYVGTNNTESILTGGGLKLPTQSATPTTPINGNGTIAVGKNGGSYFIYVYLDNQWRSASLS